MKRLPQQLAIATAIVLFGSLASPIFENIARFMAPESPVENLVDEVDTSERPSDAVEPEPDDLAVAPPDQFPPDPDQAINPPRIGPPPDFDNSEISSLSTEDLIRLIAGMGFSIVFSGAGLFIILSKRYDESDNKWAYGVIGTVIGYWLG